MALKIINCQYVYKNIDIYFGMIFISSVCLIHNAVQVYQNTTFFKV